MRIATVIGARPQISKASVVSHVVDLLGRARDLFPNTTLGTGSGPRGVCRYGHARVWLPGRTAHGWRRGDKSGVRTSVSPRREPQ
jgi:hypothetical protein